MSRFALLGALALLVSGCALTTDKIDVPYQQLGAVSTMAGASAASVSVTAQDGRTSHRDRVGTKKNGYGMEMAPIVATNDIPQTVASAVEQTLRAEGYRTEPGHAALTVDVLNFYNDFKVGVFTGDAVADVELMVTVRDPANTIVFTRTYDGSGKEADIMMASGSNARAALIKALQNCVNSMVSDQTLHAAIKAAQQPGGTMPSS